MNYGKLYFTHRREVNQLRAMAENNMVSIKEAAEFGISRNKINKWEKEEKIFPLLDGNKKLYNRARLKKLLLEGKKSLRSQ